MEFSIITLKAFGDFVIACNSVQVIQNPSSANANANTNRPVVIAGEYVRPLASALGIEAQVQVKFIGKQGNPQWADVPAAFDVRKRGLLPALHSLMELRSILGNLDKNPHNGNFVFDNKGIREFFLCPHRKLNSLPKEAGNIYLSYRQFFTSNGFTLLPHQKRRGYTPQNAVIIPAARQRPRIIPASIIAQADALLKERGCVVTVVTLEGENIEIPKNVHHICLPRSFQNLIAVIKESDLVITADSLPSHLGEYLNIPQFIFAPTPKDYMLPQSAYESNGWTTFDKPQRFSHWLDTYLCKV